MSSSESHIKLKVCGMKYRENLEEIALVAPDFLGFIFYEKSPRFMPNSLKPGDLEKLPHTINKVGVFVNASYEFVVTTMSEYKLEFAQLHGGESFDYCSKIKATGVKVIKVIHVEDKINVDQLKAYESVVDYFLFDTKSKAYGGTGNVFNWKALDDYNLSTPYFLSGGLDLQNTAVLNQLKVTPFAIDVNSKFEIKPGLKDVQSVKILKDNIAANFTTN